MSFSTEQLRNLSSQTYLVATLVGDIAGSWIHFSNYYSCEIFVFILL